MFYAYSFYKREVELQQAHSDFLGAVTHELKTPLANIRLCLDTLERPDLSSEQVSTYLKRAHLAIDKLIHHIDAIISLGQTKLRVATPQAIDLYSFVEDCLNQIDLIVDGKIECRFQISKEITVSAPIEELRLVVLTLLDNAVKYTGKTDKPLIVLKTEQIGSKKVEFSVIDNGAGLSDEEKKNLFEPFWRSPRVRTKNPEGTGLGLALAKKISKRINVQMKIDSAGVDRGTRVSLVLPVEQGEKS